MQPSQLHDHLLRKTVAEGILLRVPRQVRKRQNCQLDRPPRDPHPPHHPTPQPAHIQQHQDPGQNDQRQ